MPLTPATRLGPYEIIAPLGAGGMGEVYRARDLLLKRDIAIKVLPDDVASSPERLARLEHEATTVAGLNHPNIVILHSIEEVEGTRFLTMELVDGRSLDQSREHHLDGHALISGCQERQGRRGDLEPSPTVLIRKNEVVQTAKDECDRILDVVRVDTRCFEKLLGLGLETENAFEAELLDQPRR